MVFPVQARDGIVGDVDAELAFALQSRESGVDWVLPDELRSALRGSPGLDAPLEGLPVGIFLQAEVERVGDPLFGVLRRLAALTDAEVALIPVLIRYLPGAQGVAGSGELAAAVLAARSGRVAWFGVVGGGEGQADDPALLAAITDALARTLTGG